MKKNNKKEIKKEKKYSINFILDSVTEIIVTAIKKINKYLTNKSKSIIVKSIIRIALCLILLGFLEIPFLIVGKIGEGIIYLLTSTFKEVFSSIWISAINYSYLIFSLIILFKVVTEMSKRKEYKFEVKESTKIGENIYYAFNTILKVMIYISLIPLCLIGLLLFAILGMFICLITHGIFIIGPILTVVGLIIIITSSLSYIYDIVESDKGGNK